MVPLYKKILVFDNLYMVRDYSRGWSGSRSRSNPLPVRFNLYTGIVEKQKIKMVRRKIESVAASSFWLYLRNTI